MESSSVLTLHRPARRLTSLVMKTEERHQLHENELAGAMDRGMRRVEPYANQILIAVLALAVLVIGFFVWRRSNSAAGETAWAAYAKAETADDFLTVAEEHATTPAAAWANLRAAEQFLNQGLRTATSDRKSTEDNLKQAEEALQKLLQNQSIAPQVRERALYAMAVCRETQSGADTTKAVEAYEALKSEFPQSPQVAMAEQRIKDLKSEATRDFYAWFDRQPRKPEDRPKPKELSGGPLTGGTADPFILGPDATPAQSSNPDRPPSPSAPQPAGPIAAPFPGTTPDAAAPAPADLPESPAPVATPPATEAPAATETPPAATPAAETPAAATETKPE